MTLSARLLRWLVGLTIGATCAGGCGVVGHANADQENELTGDEMRVGIKGPGELSTMCAPRP